MTRRSTGCGRTLAACAIGVLVGACAEPAPDGFRPTVEVVDGVEIATLPPLPDLLDPDHFWQLEVLREVRTVLPGIEEPLLFDPAQLVELTDGRLFVHDPPADRPLVLFDAETETVLARFGRRGRGPNELGGLVTLAETADGALAVFDYQNRRVHRYGPDGSELGGATVDADLINGVSAATPDGRAFLVETFSSPEEIWSHDLHVVDPSTGNDEVLLGLPGLPPGREYSWRSGRALWTALSGGIVGMWGGETRFSVYDADGSRIREVRLPLTTRVLTEPEIEDQIRAIGDLARRLRPGPMGLTNYLWPVTDSVFGMLTGELWRAAEDPSLPPGVQLWRLFTVDGDYLGVMNYAVVVGRGDGDTFWVRDLDESFHPVLQEVRLVRGGQMEVPEEGADP